ncbi:MAG: hypothetical protein SD837_20300 [Candidatus Electrothrix scaldis]|nr:MAG: hypothetical protein SD837_20300 [Candidatus Electrothrix sp. GW3-3]
MNYLVKVILLFIVFAVPAYAKASSSFLLFLPAIISSPLDESRNVAPKAFIDSVVVKDGTITLQGHFKDDDNDPFVSAAWIIQNDKGITLYEFSGLEITAADMVDKGEITVFFTVTTGEGVRQKISNPTSTKITV